MTYVENEQLSSLAAIFRENNLLTFNIIDLQSTAGTHNYIDT